MTLHKIAVYAGDGIGQEVTPVALDAISRVTEGDPDHKFEFTHLSWGVAHFQEHGRLVPDDFLEILRPYDAIFLGAVGWPDLVPDYMTLEPLKRIRQTFDQFACVRPSRLYPGLKSVLAGKGPAEIDLVVVRENSEGEYIDNGGRFRQGTPDEVAVQTAVHSRRGVERILRYAFDLAAKRRKRLTMITKSNAMRYSYVMWDDIFEELIPEYPEIECDRQHCDAAVMNFVRCPEHFDVVVASNLFGDLLTDLGGIIGGGLGLAPSTNVNPTREFPSMFEPVHGSAPDIAGQGIANPIAAILSAALMLDHLGAVDSARRLEQAVADALESGAKTRDLGGELTTNQMGERVLEKLERFEKV